MKNRVLRSALAVILVIAMVLTMAACNNTDPVETTAPVVTSAPAATTTPTEAPVVTVAPTDAPAVEVVDDDEAQLADYGITFPEFDLEYVASGDYEEYDMTFGLKVDTDNIYQEAYDFTISAKISAVKLDGSSLSKSKYGVASLDYLDKLNYNDAGDFSDWTGSSKYYFQVAATGVYTVTYTIEVEHDKDDEYGYYAPGEVDEKYEITKTYTVEKAELKLKTSDDAFEVEDSIFFADAKVSKGDTFDTEVGGDYSYSVDVTSCDGTVIGEYPLSITIKDDDSNVVDPSDIVLDNYYVTVSEGTRYILSAEDVAKANAIRKMYYNNFTNGKTTEYAQETITYYETLTAGQKVMAAVETDNDEWTRISAYLVAETPVDEDDIEEVEYNMNRDYIIDEVEDAIDAYMTASTTAKKDAALTALCELILSIDNTANEYGSDLLYVLGSLSTGYYTGTDYVYTVVATTNNSVTTYEWATTSPETSATTYAPYDSVTGSAYIVQATPASTADPADIEGAVALDTTAFDYTNDAIVYTIYTTDYDANDINLLSFQVSEDDGDYSATFGYIMGEVVSSAAKGVVNAEYDGYLKDWIEDYEDALHYYGIVVKDQEIEQADIDNLTKYIGNMEGEYVDLITYQLSYKVEADDHVDTDDETGHYKSGNEVFDGTDKVSALNSDLVEAADKIVARWDAYIALIEAYGFEDSYIDNANADDMTATFDAMKALLGYDLKNATLKTEVYGTDTGAAVYECVNITTVKALNSGYYYCYAGTPTISDKDINLSGYTIADATDYDYYIIINGVNRYFKSNDKSTTVVKWEEKTLSNVLFAYTDLVTGDVEYTTPDLFVDSVLDATETMMQVAIAVQTEVDAVKQDLVNYVVSTGYYTSHINGAANLAYAAALDTAAKLYGNDGSDVTTFNYVYKVDSDGVTTDAIAMYPATTAYADAAALVGAYNSDFGTSYATTGWTLAKETDDSTLSTISTAIDTSSSLSDLEAWIDYQVLAQALYEDSDFYSDLEKKGLDTATEELFEDIIEGAWDRVDEMDEAIEDGTFTELSADMTTSGANVTLEYDNTDMTFTAQSAGSTLYKTAAAALASSTEADDKSAVTLTFGTDGKITPSAATAGTYYFVVTGTVEYTGSEAYLGTYKDVEILVTLKITTATS
ncbi:MAG: hypothetical protein R3Y45_09400 [Bacillota bacterium]